MRARDRRRVVGSSSTSYSGSSLPHIGAGMNGVTSISTVSPLPLIATLPSGFPSHSISVSGDTGLLLHPIVSGSIVPFNTVEQHKPLDLSVKIEAPAQEQSLNLVKESEVTGEDVDMVLDLSTRSNAQRVNGDSPLPLNCVSSPAGGVVDCATAAALSEPLDCSSTASSSSSSSSSAETAPGGSMNGWSSGQDQGRQLMDDGRMTSLSPQDYSVVQRINWRSSSVEKSKVWRYLLLIDVLP